LLVGCGKTEEAATPEAQLEADEAEVFEEEGGALAGQAVNVGCSRPQKVKSCTEIPNGIRVKKDVKTRNGITIEKTYNLRNTCGSIAKKYSCPSSIQSKFCRQRCEAGESCSNGECRSLCGNGAVDAGETCSSCIADAPCAAEEICQDGACVAPVVEAEAEEVPAPVAEGQAEGGVQSIGAVVSIGEGSSVNVTLSADQVYEIGSWDVDGSRANFWIRRPERGASVNTGYLLPGESYGPGSPFHEDRVLGGTGLTLTLNFTVGSSAQIIVSEQSPLPEGDVPRGPLYVFSVNKGATRDFHLMNVSDALSLTYLRREMRERVTQVGGGDDPQAEPVREIRSTYPVAIVSVAGTDREIEQGMQLVVNTASGTVYLFATEIYEDRLLFRGSKAG
ncbi:MAG: hypothetical protein AABX37_01060, partial [Nanoarchaeota archaeon]